MDAIDELAQRIINAVFSGLHGQMHVTPTAKVLEVLRAANITIPPSPPEPGSLWEHKETGERRFVYDIYETWPQVMRFLPTAIPASGPTAMSMSDWHAWSANATCLVPGKGA